ncbi:MAG: hypothetical protein L6R39_007355 [Caloplaca ligustica]|nr:MAG: hypothetical protein L6R39_007355 [Caloplaca ligustica]
MPGLKRKLTDSAPSSTSKPAKKQKLPLEPRRLPLSKETVVDSSDDDAPQASANVKKSAAGSNSRTGVKKAAKKSKSPGSAANATSSPSDPSKEGSRKSPVNISSSSESSNSEESESLEGSPTRSGSKANRPIPQKRSTTAEETDRDTDSGGPEETQSESQSESESETDREPVQVDSISANQEPPPPSDPPPGFEAATVNPSLAIRDLFTEQNLRGRQIWHIIAPASAPISSLKEVPMQKVATGAPILSYEDGDFGLVVANSGADTMETVPLIPSPKDNSYRLPSVKIFQTLRLQQIVKLPSVSNPSSNGTIKPPTTHVKRVRQQPEGLRMRYRPFGDESSSEDPEDTAPRFRIPPVFTPAPSVQEPMPTEDVGTASPAKEKKRHQHEPQAEATQAGRKETTEEKAERRAKKKRPKSENPSHSNDRHESYGVSNIQSEDEHHEQSIIPEKPKAKKKDKSAKTPKALNDPQRDGVEPEKVKTKRKKRKSEAAPDDV